MLRVSHIEQNLVVHPAVPIGGDLGSIVVHVDMGSELDPAIAPVEVVRVLEVLVAILVDAHQGSDLQIIVSAK